MTDTRTDTRPEGGGPGAQPKKPRRVELSVGAELATARISVTSAMPATRRSAITRSTSARSTRRRTGFSA